ncbi:MAG: Hsp20/alpha crystallin family protein [Chitinophagaceae bacterium]
MSNLVRTGNRRLDPWLRDFFDVENVFGSDLSTSAGRNFPAVNISEDEKSFGVDVVVPGYKKEDFKVNIDDDVLTISAEKKSESTENGDNNKQYSRREYSYSSFTRSFRLPENAKDDEISASYNDGILKLTIPKTENQVKAKKEIPIG